MISLPKQFVRVLAGCRTYARAVKRRPLAVSLGPDAVKHVAGVEDSHAGEWISPKLSKVKVKLEVPERHRGLLIEQEVSEKDQRFQLPPGMTFEKLKEGDKRFGPVVMAARSRKAREKQSLIVLEGHRLIRDAMKAGAKITALYFSKVEHLEGLPLEELDAELYKVHYSHLKIWSDLRTPPGVLAICRMPKSNELQPISTNHLPLTLVCDNIRDPGNMGTLLRTAAAIPCRRVILMKGCVDIWDPKVLRSGAGAHFFLHMLPNISWHNVGNYLHTSNIYLADGSVQHQSPARVSRSTMKQITSGEFETFAEFNEDTQTTMEVDTSYMDKEHVKLFENFPISSKSCFNCDFSHDESVLVIGGETHGLSAEAHKLAFDRNGEKVFIPMEEGIDSLNASIAATVIMFEMKRQFAAAISENMQEGQDRENIL